MPHIQRHPLPEEHADLAAIPGIPFARFWGDEIPPDFDHRIEQFKLNRAGHVADTLNILALSGGGPNGAFGAGLLAGWTKAGDRPDFRVITGISTGALIATFAFLGPEMDKEMENFFTTTSTKDILVRRNLMFLLKLDSATYSTPLRKMLLELFSPPVIEAIAAEHRKGRSLYIGTTHLDAGRPVIWNIGEIASSNQPGVTELLADIFLASASVPGIFPPVFIQVVANGKVYDEMHVDGGTSSQIYCYPPALRLKELMEKLQIKSRRTRIFLIRNSRLKADWMTVSPQFSEIAICLIGSLIRSQGIGDVNQIYLVTLRAQIDFNLAYIPESFTLEKQEEFDPEYMKTFFDLGFQQGKDGFSWQQHPIGFE